VWQSEAAAPGVAALSMPPPPRLVGSVLLLLLLQRAVCAAAAPRLRPLSGELVGLNTSSTAVRFITSSGMLTSIAHGGRSRSSCQARSNPCSSWR
jgi:hypothetical protein